MKGKAVLLVLCALLLGACNGAIPFGKPTATPNPCRPELVDSFFQKIDGVARRFDDTNELANSTPRMSLPPLIQDMQEIRRDAQDIELPECAGYAQDKLVAYMDAVIDTYIAFVAQESDSAVDAKINAASFALSQYEGALDSLVRLATP